MARNKKQQRSADEKASLLQAYWHACFHKGLCVERKTFPSIFKALTKAGLVTDVKLGATPKIAVIRRYADELNIIVAPIKAPQIKPIKKKKPIKTESDKFLKSWEWLKLRYKVINKYGRKCMCCGATPETGAVICVDHIKPRHTHPELKLDEDNLQVLCYLCNKGKGAWDDTDFRKP